MKAIQLPECNNPRVPVAEHPWHHMVEIQPRFNDFDIFRHVNNSSYINVNFYSPTYFNEPVVVLTACVRISQRSFTLEQRVVNPDTGDVKCAATVVLAAFDPETATSAQLRPEWTAGLARMES